MFFHFQCSEANDHVGYENYRHVCHKWHYKITKAIVFCLESKDYMQIRNAFIILMRIQPHFPVISKLAQIIERKVEKVKEEEKNQRQDLFVLASSYIAILKLKAPQLMKESDFHQVTDRVKSEPAESKIINGDSKTGEMNKTLNPLKSGLKFSIISEKRETRERSELKKTKTVDREIKIEKETPVREVKESRESREPTAPREKSSKELKKEEKQREKERERAESEARKKDKEKRREKRPTSPNYYEERDRETRELSSVSNSSNGSIHQRSQEPQEHDRGEFEIRLTRIEKENC